MLNQETKKTLTTDIKALAWSAIDRIAPQAVSISHRIWELAELSLKEFQSASLYIAELEAAGFTVETNLGGMETAFLGRYGHGKPVIGILGEFDALSGLSQAACATGKEKIKGTESGHGCGHNILGAASFAAAAGVKNYLQETGSEGTVIFFGCPGEEGGAGKAFLAREGYWKQLDAALTWHPSDVNEVASGSNLSSIQKLYTFDGVAAHAAGSPEHGRSALDAAELMNIGVQYLREHMPRTASVHYAITDAGGPSPNVVQPHAEVLYMIRDSKVHSALELVNRVDKIAWGAALMTGTSVQSTVIDGTAETIPNSVLEELLQQNYETVGVTSYAEDEWQYASELAATYQQPGQTAALPDKGQRPAAMMEAIEEALQTEEGGQKVLADILMPLWHHEIVRPGSTDVGDVSWQTPTAQIHAVCYPIGTPGHSWQVVSSAASSISDKAIIHAAKVLAGAAIDLMRRPEILQAAREEFEKRTAAGYVCPIPPDIKPTAI